MVSLTALWLPILLSAVAVFIVSSVLHMVLSYHKNDYVKLPKEAEVLDGLRNAGVVPGAYYFPCPDDHKEMGSPEMLERYTTGPVGIMTVLPNRPPMMPKHLAMWFVHSLVVSFFLAYVASRTLAAGSDYLAVFRVVGAVGFLAYSAAHASDSIWKGQAWSTTTKHIVDGLAYALVTAGAFAWLWP
ncbi:MAG: hypothetical protein GY906_08615 [bacterium]|nr:hypothetical protein [bacterium]